MLGIGGKFVSGKGMVAVPNLIDLTPPQAESAILLAGLVIGSKNSSSTSNSGQANKVNSQSIASGGLVDYGTEISYGYLYYVEPPQPSGPPVVITFGPCEDNYDQVDYESRCDGQKYIYPYSILKYRKKILVNGIWDGISYSQDCDDVRVPEFEKDPEVIPGECGAPVTTTCDPEKNWVKSGNGFKGACGTNNKYTFTQRYKNNCPGIEDKLDKTDYACCYKAGTCGEFSPWSGSASGQSRTKTCYKESSTGGCSSYTVTENRCTESCTEWGGGTCVNKKKTQTKTCTAKDCTTAKEYRTVSCTGGPI